jgi:hypothetical protein
MQMRPEPAAHPRHANAPRDRIFLAPVSRSMTAKKYQRYRWRSISAATLCTRHER